MSHLYAEGYKWKECQSRQGLARFYVEVATFYQLLFFLVYHWDFSLGIFPSVFDASPLRFQLAEEALHGSVIRAVSLAADGHRSDLPQAAYQPACPGPQDLPVFAAGFIDHQAGSVVVLPECMYDL